MGYLLIEQRERDSCLGLCDGCKISSIGVNGQLATPLGGRWVMFIVLRFARHLSAIAKSRAFDCFCLDWRLCGDHSSSARGLC